MKDKYILVLKDFKEFALRGNVLDLAIGIVNGSAFGAIVNSLVNDILMPFLGLIFGGVDFSNKYWLLKSGVVPGPYDSLLAAQKAGAVTINYGLFFTSIVSFVIIAWALYLFIKSLNQFQPAEEEAAATEPTTKECLYCFSVIPIRAIRCPNCTSEL
jgi:large conductance mechanosensitive channel